MKRIFAVLLVVTMLFALAACGNKEQAPSSPPAGKDDSSGGAGSIGWTALQQAKPDGHTLGFINLPNFNSSIYRRVGRL